MTGCRTRHPAAPGAPTPLFDQFVLEAHDAASVAIQRQNAADGFAFETVDSLETLDKATLRLVARDRDGQVLFGIRGGTMTIDGDAASFYGKWTSTDQQTYEQTYTELWRMKGGDAVLSGHAGSATVSVPVSTR